MTSEVRYIIENRKFKRTWGDFSSYLEFIAPVFTLVMGAVLLHEGEKTSNYIIGILLLIVTFPLTKFLLLRLRQLNEFEEFQRRDSGAGNFDFVIEKLRGLNIIEVDKDIHNLTINAKYKSTGIPPGIEWLTIVCVDDRILVNSRPQPASMVVWIRRNAMIDFARCLREDT